MKVSERWQKVSKINIKSNKLVSVNLTTYNRAYLLSRAIESILKQTYKDIEILIVDDCSTDETEETVNFYQNRYKFIRYIKHSYNKGNAHSRNTAMNNCTGYYVAFMDDDDEWIDINKKRSAKGKIWHSGLLVFCVTSLSVFQYFILFEPLLVKCHYS